MAKILGLLITRLTKKGSLKRMVTIHSFQPDLIITITIHLIIDQIKFAPSLFEHCTCNTVKFICEAKHKKKFK